MTAIYKKRINDKNRGFTLVEIAMVLLIITLLMTGLVPTISRQFEQRQMNETRRQLDDIHQALIGYAVINGRLPCPASPTSNGEESPTGGGNCTNLYNGFVPAATLGIESVADNQGNNGFAVDAWGNRIRYAVTSSNSNAFTTTNGMSTTGISNLLPNLLVCASATAAGFNGTNCGANNSLTSSPGVPVVIFSTGKNGSYGGTGTDEAANLDGTNANGNRTFVSHTPTAGANEFDDLVIWLSPNTLLNRMIAAGKLP